MSIGGNKNPNDWFFLIQALFIGIACFVIGLWALVDRFFIMHSFIFSFMNELIDLGTYHRIIGIALIVLSLIYLYIGNKELFKRSIGN